MHPFLFIHLSHARRKREYTFVSCVVYTNTVFLECLQSIHCPLDRQPILDSGVIGEAVWKGKLQFAASNYLQIFREIAEGRKLCCEF